MITLSEQELQEIINYLGEVPFKYSAKLIALFQQKVIEKDSKKQNNG